MSGAADSAHVTITLEQWVGCARPYCRNETISEKGFGKLWENLVKIELIYRERNL